MFHSYCYLTLFTLFISPPNVCPGGIPAHATYLYNFPAVVSTNKNILPPGGHLYPPQNTEAHISLYQTLLLPCLPRSYHTFRITSTTPLPPLKYVLTLHSAASGPPFSATTDHGASPLPHILPPCHKYPVPASKPPTPPLLPATCKCNATKFQTEYFKLFILLVLNNFKTYNHTFYSYPTSTSNQCRRVCFVFC